MPYLADKPISEDGFYMLTVAWNFGQGKGFAYNQDFKTSGVQPLAAMLYGVLAFISNQAGYYQERFSKDYYFIFGSSSLFVRHYSKHTLSAFFNEFDEDIIFFPLFTF
ncbi:MAG: hypothetical protein IPM51_10305 [Sphingobacteriaceae bacterium]|nr:hypothetical protein [Sphingobacteriaceae bacterium]